MAADFFLANPTFDILPLKPTAAFKWYRLNNPEVQYSIAADEQYLCFHIFLLKQLRHTEVGRAHDPTFAYELGLSVRAGAIKAAVLMAGSIIEAALRAIAETRGYELNKDPRRRTFGNVLNAWQQDGNPKPDVALVWAELNNHQLKLVGLDCGLKVRIRVA
jgi:hypothetical protein